MKPPVVMYRRRRLPARTRLVVTVLLAALIVAIPLGVFLWGRSSSTFMVQKVIVSGDKRVSELEIQRLLRSDYLGHNLFNVTRDDVADSLSAIPFIAAVTVNRDFPLTLRVGVKEHVPAAFALSRGRWYAVAEDGYVVAQVSEDSEGLTAPTTTEPELGAGETTGTASPEPSASPDVTPTGTPDEDGAEGATDGGDAGATDEEGADQNAVDLTQETWFDGSLTALAAGPRQSTLALPRMSAGGTVEAGKMLDDDEALLGIKVIASVPSRLREDLAVVASKKGEVTLYFAGGPEVVWGDGERPLAKGIALNAVLQRYRQKNTRCTYMNVTVPDRVLARPMLK